MPIYGYICNKCSHPFETLVFSGDTPECPKCQATDLTQQLSLTAPPAKSGGDMPRCDHATDRCGGCPAAAFG
jgi:putative FmdB family regulatory protein